MRLNYDQLKQHAERAWEGMRRMYPQWREAYHFAAPGLDPWTWDGEDSPGDPGPYDSQGFAAAMIQPEVYDSTLANAAQDLATLLTSEVFPPGQDWCDFEAGESYSLAVANDETRRNELAQLKRGAFKSVHASNWSKVVHQMAFDGVVSGTGIIRTGMRVDKRQPVSYEAVPQLTVARELGAAGEIAGYYRKPKMTDEAIHEHWPEAPEVSRRDERDRRYLLQEATRWMPKDRQWQYDVWVERGGETLELARETLPVSPWACWRFSRVVREPHGRSKVMQVLPDVRTLNSIVEILLRAAAARTVGAYKAKSGSVNNLDNLDLTGGSVVELANLDDLMALDLPGDPQLAQLLVSDYQQRIKEAMLVDRLPPASAGIRTAYEIAQRQRQAMIALGGPFHSFSEDVGPPVIASTVWALQRAGRIQGLLPDTKAGNPPFKFDGTDIHLRFQSPLSQAQRITDASSILQFAQMSMEAAGQESYVAGVRTEEIPRVLGEKLNITDDLIRPAEERKQRSEGLAAATAPGGSGGLPTGLPEGASLQ